MMNARTLLRRVSLLALVCLWAFPAQALFDVFIYTGRLKVGGGNPDPSDRFDLRFSFFDSLSGASPKLGETFVSAVAADTNGLFSVRVEVSSFFDVLPHAEWVELAVRRTGGTSSNYVTLSPRQRLAPVPTALHAQQAEIALSMTGMVSTAQLPANVARLDMPQVFTAPPSFAYTAAPPFSCVVTMTVPNLSADLLDGLNSTAFWRRETNSGVSRLAEPANLPFEVRMQNRSVLRLQEGRSNLGWSLATDPGINNIREGVAGSAVFGRSSLVESNADYCFVAGDGNQILTGARNSTIAGGAMNRIHPNGLYAFIGGGYGNEISSRFAGVLSGNNGEVRGDFSAVLAGENGSVGAAYSTVGGGGANQIQPGANGSVIPGGTQNVIHSNAFASVIVGGQLNHVYDGANRSFIGGGDYGEIGAMSYCSAVGGGTRNRIEFNSPFSAIPGGSNNLIRSNCPSAFALGDQCVAGAPRSFAWGHGANANHTGSFVIADGQYSSFFSSNINEFAVRAAGGVRFETAGAGLTVDGMRLTSGGGGLVLPAGSVNTSNLVDRAVLAEILDDDGAGSGLDADRLDGFSSEDFWRLTGNASTTPGVNFLGTTDNQALELKVDNLRALRLQPDDTFVCDIIEGTTGLANSPSLVAGYSGNSIPAGVPGAIIAGGGAAENPCLNGPGVPMPNLVTAPFASVLGGLGNANHGALSAIGGGARNTITTGGNYSHIANGVDNLIDQTDASSISGGTSNRIGFDADAAVIGGGMLNHITTNADGAVISGGDANQIGVNAALSTISGGGNNLIQTFATSASIGGGQLNRIEANADGSTISGGGQNAIGQNGLHATIGGGGGNTIESGAHYGTVAGGFTQKIGRDAYAASIGGGTYNLITTNADFATIPGGRYAKAQNYGQFAYSSGPFAVAGDAQASLYVLRGITTNATRTEIFLDGINRRMTLANHAAWTFEMMLVARSSTGEVAGYRHVGVVWNHNGGLFFSPEPKETLFETIGSWDAEATISMLDDVFQVMVTGSTGKIVRWVATVRTVEVVF